MGRTRVLIMFLYGHMTQVWSCTGKQKGSQKQRWVLAFAIGITVAFMSTSGCTSCGLGPEYCIGRRGRHWLLSLWGIPNTPRTYLPTLKEKHNLKDWALWSKAAESLRKLFNKLAQRKTLSNALLWGVRSPMRKTREGNYAETAVRSTSTIAESNQKLLTCILYWHKWMLILRSSSRGRREKKNINKKKTKLRSSKKTWSETWKEKRKEEGESER